MTAPITPDERAEWRETVATLDEAWEVDDPTRPLVTEHATLALLAHVASAVPRLLDALDTAEEFGIGDWRATTWAYEQARAALDKHQKRADTAEAEVARLRERVDRDRVMHEAYRPEVVAEVAVHLDDDTDWEAVARWCGGTIGNTQDPSGEYTSYVTIPGVGEAWHGSWIIQRHDLSFDVRAEVAGPSEESVARLRAATSPAWDEDTVVASIRETFEQEHYWSRDVSHDGTVTERCSCDVEMGDLAYREHIAEVVVAVIRRHLPVKPDREAVRDVIAGYPIGSGYYGTSVSVEEAAEIADAVLAEWPGESRAQVEAEALREFAARQDSWCEAGRGEQIISREAMRDALIAEADRIEKEK